MWEKVDADLTQLKTDLNQLQGGQEELSRDVREVRTHQRDMNRRMSIFNDTLAGIQADYRDIYDRVREIERRQT
jgi:chromosome segregation ATPase